MRSADGGAVRGGGWGGPDRAPARAHSSMDPSGAYPRFVAYAEPPGPQASTSTSTATATAATGRGAGPVRRLPKEGVAIMERKSLQHTQRSRMPTLTSCPRTSLITHYSLDYYNTVSTNPPEAARVELAEAIRRVGPRCAFYTPQKVYQSFVNARTKARKPSAPGGSGQSLPFFRKFWRIQRLLTCIHTCGSGCEAGRPAGRRAEPVARDCGDLGGEARC